MENEIKRFGHLLRITNKQPSAECPNCSGVLDKDNAPAQSELNKLKKSYERRREPDVVGYTYHVSYDDSLYCPHCKERLNIQITYL